MIQEKKYGTFADRALAGIIDSLILSLAIMLFISLLIIVGVIDANHANEFFRNLETGITELDPKAIEVQNHFEFILQMLIAVVTSIYIASYLSSKSQATIGKRVMKVYVGNHDGSRLSKGRSSWRAIVSVLISIFFPALVVSALMVIFTKEKTALHDIICRTRVFKGSVGGEVNG